VNSELRTEFIKNAIWHGDLKKAESLLAEHPELANSDIHTAAITGDDAAQRRFNAADPESVHAKSPPFDGDALNYLGLSKYLRLDPSRTDALLRCATALLDAGANPNTGFWWNGEFETALYGAAGVAHHAGMTELLLDRGADPNDGEVVYHSPEEQGNAAMKVVVETGRVTPENLSLMLIRKIDWHDADGVKFLLEHGADPARLRERGFAPLHHALARCDGPEIMTLLLDHGASALDTSEGITAVVRAAREGRYDVLAEFEKRGVPLQAEGLDRLLMALARGPDESAKQILEQHPEYVGQVKEMGGRLLVKWCNAWNWEGMRRLLELGVSASAPYAEGDGYFNLPKGVLPIQAAAWFLDARAIAMLLERGADPNAVAENGATPLDLFVLGCTESYWSEYRCLPPAELLLDAGARLNRVKLPTGYPEFDELFRSKR
jgi:ankyrin repeat protein